MSEERIREILRQVKPLAAEYYRLTGKPLGVTGEVAEMVAADILGLELAPARTPGFDATRELANGKRERIQIKGRALGPSPKPGQRLGRIQPGADCNIVLLVILNNEKLDPIEMWEADYDKVVERLAQPGSISRNERGALSLHDFKKLGRCVWSKDGSA